MSRYPFPCVRCGFCCLAEPCPVAMRHHGIGKGQPCPSLQWDGPEALCGLAALIPADVLGIGSGCCIKARAIAGGVAYDFASLPPNLKTGLAQRARGQMIPQIQSR